MNLSDVYSTGWIPYELRTAGQKLLTNEFHETICKYDDIVFQFAIPDKVVLHELEVQTTGALLPRIHQLTGSCVGCGGARAYTHAILGDVAHRGDQEEIKIPFPFATYGVGRKIAGMNGPGEGSFGAAQAEAVEKFGMLAWDSTLVEQPTIESGWATWTGAIERTWSHPSAWKKPKAEVEQEAAKYRIQTVTKINDPEQACNLLAQGYGVTLASNFGTRPRVEGDVLLGRWNASWAHQMSCGGYWKHPTHGRIFLIDNQWGDAHGPCPTLSKLGVNGSFWMLESDFAKICSGGEVYGHSNTLGFPARQFNWSNILSM